jgi:tripartite-type tricarboxylate transporter receptor subunit TctC
MPWRTVLLGAFLTLLFCLAGVADEYPRRPITLVVPYPPGGGVDGMARIVADKLSVALGQPVVVDNRGGGGGNIGTRIVVKSAPDGYTLLLGHTGTISINPTLYTTAGYDPRKDFQAIGLIASMPVALLANPAFPPKSVSELIALAKTSPGQIAMGTSAIGTGGYLCAELFKVEADVDLTIVPYKGTAPLMADLVGDHVPVAFGVLPPALGNIAAGQLRVLAVTSATRFSLLPDVPTANESGLPGFEAVLHYGLLAPAGTPRPIVDRLNKELRDITNLEDVQRRIHAEGGDPLASTVDEYTADIDRELTKWGSLIHRLNLKVD